MNEVIGKLISWAVESDADVLKIVDANGNVTTLRKGAEAHIVHPFIPDEKVLSPDEFAAWQVANPPQSRVFRVASVDETTKTIVFDSAI